MIAGMVHGLGSTQVLGKDEVLFSFHQQREEMHTCLPESLQLHSSEGSAALAIPSNCG